MVKSNLPSKISYNEENTNTNENYSEKKDFDDVKFMVSKQEFMKILSADLHEDN